MKDRETARMRKYGESKTTRIMMATVPHVTSGLGLRKFQADGFLLTRVYIGTEPLKEQGVVSGDVQTQTPFRRGKNLWMSPCMWLRGPQNSMDTL